MSIAEGYVLPKPGIPKTFGILNIIFGVVLMLAGFCLSGFTMVMPMALEMAEKEQKTQQAKADADYKAKLKEIDDRLTAAKTDDEKKTIQVEKDTAVASPPPTPPDISAITGMYKNPTIMGFTLGFYGSGAIMNLFLLISGIGLVRLKPWGRSMAVGLASIQILRIVGLLAVYLVVVQPVYIVEFNKMMTAFANDPQLKNAPGNVGQSLEMAKAMTSMGGIFAVGGAIVAMIYPILTIILLSTKGAKAACQSAKPTGNPDFRS
jgi:hypothetical protein